MSHKIDRFDSFPDCMTIDLGNGQEIMVEKDRYGELSLSLDYEEHHSYGGSTSCTLHRWLERDDAIALARFVLEQYGEAQP